MTGRDSRSHSGIGVGCCIRRNAKLVSNKEMDNPEFIRDVRTYLSQLPVSTWSMRDYLIDAYRDYPGEVIHPLTGQAVYLDLEEFVECDLRDWFRDLCKPIEPGRVPYIQNKTRDRFRTVATILRAADPVGTMMWGKRAANDNTPQS